VAQGDGAVVIGTYYTFSLMRVGGDEDLADKDKALFPADLVCSRVKFAASGVGDRIGFVIAVYFEEHDENRRALVLW
jgi:hypothetical protein